MDDKGKNAPLAQKPLDQKPRPKHAEDKLNPPPFLGVLLVIALAVAIAIGYGNYVYNNEKPVQPTSSGTPINTPK